MSTTAVATLMHPRAGCPPSTQDATVYRFKGAQHPDPHSQMPRLLGHSAHRSVGNTDGQKQTINKIARCVPGKRPAQSAAQKGPISMLQEFVQCSQRFHVPAKYSVLQWSYDSQMADAATLEFRAVVAFLLEGVPHHVAGTWQPKKKDAQRDAAERALGLFVGKWSEHALGPQQGNATPGDTMRWACSCREEDLVAECCRTLDVCSNTPPSWSVRSEGDGCIATVEMTLLGVPHQFAGASQRTEAEARADASRRVLWYLQRPGFKDTYEPDPASAAIVTSTIPAPPKAWTGSVEDAALEVTDRKTAIMRVQNRLQQTFVLRHGRSAWSWSYEIDPDDGEWPALCKATVDIPVIGKTFVGDWVRGQREAQLDTLVQVTQFLDGLDTRRK